MGVARARDLEARGVCRPLLRTMHREGTVRTLARGVYCLPGYTPSESQAMALVAARASSAVFCLVSALRLHGMEDAVALARGVNPTVPTPWIALPPTARVPLLPQCRLRVVRMSGPLLAAGVQERVVDQVRVRLFSPAKTVVDCFRFRGRPGLGVPVAVAALREFLKLHPGEDARDELRRHAALARMATVMRPYLEALA